MSIVDIVNYLLGGGYIVFGLLKNGSNKAYKNKAFFIGGIVIIILNFCFYLLDFEDIFKVFIPIIFIIFIICYTTIVNYKKEQNKNVYAYVSFIVIFSFISVLSIFLIYLSREDHVEIKEQKIKIEGLYGEEVSFMSINNIQIMDTLPKILQRTNGLGLSNLQKGYFKIEGYGICKLFIYKKHPPFIKISYNKDKYIFINYREPDETKELFDNLNKKIFLNEK